MTAAAIRVEGLGKDYRVGAHAGYGTLRDRIASFGTAVRTRAVGRADPAPSPWWTLHALDDVTFSVNEGEAVGIIGHNGAGKSTLLKILSRITKPTRGWAEIGGRVGSLLEVGTGFHPELTGRENVYFNASILGMTRREVERRFDEIVAFAEVEPFLDMPIKRYSSGMTMRLAFSVAAHLDPDVLVVDEVLAVGDLAFQRKCIGRMGEVVRDGRTLLVVSHNVAVVQSLCRRGILLEKGRTLADGPVDDVISSYLGSLEQASRTSVRDRVDRHGYCEVMVDDVLAAGELDGPLVVGRPARFEVTLNGLLQDLACELRVFNDLGHPVCTFDSGAAGAGDTAGGPEPVFTCAVDELPLVPGRYRLDILVTGGGHVQYDLTGACWFDVEQGVLGGRAIVGGHSGDVAVPHRWSTPTP